MASNTMGFTDSYSHILDVDIYPKGNDGEDGRDGASITRVYINNLNHIICVLSNGTEIDGGEIPTAEGSLKVEIVDNLPEAGDVTTIYLKPVEDASEDNHYDEFLYLKTRQWERIGSAKIDLSAYYNKTEIDEKTNAIDERIDETQEAIKNKNDAKTISTELSEQKDVYYLVGAKEKIATEKTSLYNTVVDKVNQSGVKYVAGSESQEDSGALFVDEQQVTTGLYFDIS